MVRQITDMETWLIDSEGKIFRYLIYRKVYTPYEQQHAFMDESEYEDSHYTFAFIEEAIDLGNGDWMLGFRRIYDEEEPTTGNIEYCRLSEIRLSYFDEDQDMFTRNLTNDEDDE